MYGHVRQDFKTRAAWIVHQDQRDTIIGGDIANADVLPVAAEIGKAERFLVEYLEEAGRAAAVLHIGPAGLRNRGHVEAVARCDECRLVFAKAVGRPVALKPFPVLAAAIRRLGGANAWCRDRVEELIGYERPPRFS